MMSIDADYGAGITEDGTLVVGLGSMHLRKAKPIAVKAWTSKLHPELKTQLRKLVIQEGIEEIGSNAFRDCAELCEVQLPSSLRSINWEAFKGCKSLSDIIIPEGVMSIADFAFENCTSLKKASIPESARGVSANVFRKCPNLPLIC
ncbi:MAG: leucine-rich repeat domain-containing protein, partial [Victivallales bacterium]|nr:leucine-rich repeat domain-containing protein [Victivallales bacterium]